MVEKFERTPRPEAKKQLEALRDNRKLENWFFRLTKIKMFHFFSRLSFLSLLPLELWSFGALSSLSIFLSSSVHLFVYSLASMSGEEVSPFAPFQHASGAYLI